MPSSRVDLAECRVRRGRALVTFGRPTRVRHRAGALDQFQIAADIVSAPFIVRGELSALRREQLVRPRDTGRSIEWALTERGSAIAWSTLQLRAV